MSPKDRNWFLSSLVIGLALCVAIALPTQASLGEDNYVWFGWLLLMFAVSVAANRLQMWILQPQVPAWCKPFIGVCAFIPFFIVFFPVSQWAQLIGPKFEYKNLPNLNWLTLLMLYGLFAPGGRLFDLLRAKLQPR